MFLSENKKRNLRRNRTKSFVIPNELVEYILIILNYKKKQKKPFPYMLFFNLSIDADTQAQMCPSAYLITNNDYNAYPAKPLTYILYIYAYPSVILICILEYLFSHKYLHICLFFYFAIFDSS